MEFQEWQDLQQEDLTEQIARARQQGRQAKKVEPRAKSAYYDLDKHLIVLELTNRCLFCFPPSLVNELEGVSLKEIGDVWVSSSGDSIHWDSLNISLSIPNLLLGCFGKKALMSEIGHTGGKVTSIKKAKSSKENGKKGGRPRKNPFHCPT